MLKKIIGICLTIVAGMIAWKISKPVRIAVRILIFIFFFSLAIVITDKGIEYLCNSLGKTYIYKIVNKKAADEIVKYQLIQQQEEKIKQERKLEKELEITRLNKEIADNKIKEEELKAKIAAELEEQRLQLELARIAQETLLLKNKQEEQERERKIKEAIEEKELNDAKEIANAQEKIRIEKENQIKQEERKEERIVLAKDHFKNYNNPSFTNDLFLLKIANTIAHLKLKHPTATECKELRQICKSISTNEYSDITKNAIEGSMYIFEDVIDMTNKGYCQYGDQWKTPTEMNSINQQIAFRNQLIEKESSDTVQLPPRVIVAYNEDSDNSWKSMRKWKFGKTR